MPTVVRIAGAYAHAGLAVNGWYIDPTSPVIAVHLRSGACLTTPGRTVVAGPDGYFLLKRYLGREGHEYELDERRHDVELYEHQRLACFMPRYISNRVLFCKRIVDGDLLTLRGYRLTSSLAGTSTEVLPEELRGVVGDLFGVDVVTYADGFDRLVTQQAAMSPKLLDHITSTLV